MIKVMIVMALMCPALFSGCLDGLENFESDFTIRVSGEKDLKFRGNYSFPGSGSIGRPVNVEGVVPAEYGEKASRRSACSAALRRRVCSRLRS